MSQKKCENQIKCSECGDRLTAVRTLKRKHSKNHPEYSAKLIIVEGMKVCTNHKPPRLVLLDPNVDVSVKV